MEIRSDSFSLLEFAMLLRLFFYKPKTRNRKRERNSHIRDLRYEQKVISTSYLGTLVTCCSFLHSRCNQFGQGISYVISSLQPVPAAVAFRRLVEPIAANLQADGVVAGDAKLAQQHLTRLTVIVTHANPSIEVGAVMSSSVTQCFVPFRFTSTRGRTC